jgi:hypothetical protein
MTRQYTRRNKNTWTLSSIIIATGLTASFVGLAFLSGHEYGRKAGIVTERNLANLRVNALLERENRRAPRRRNRK